MARDFAAQVPNAKWVSEITYIFTQEGWLYLAVTLDVCSRQVIGWFMQSQLTRELVIQAVLMAIWQGRSVDSVILHFDRGTSYTWQEFRVFLQTYGLASSMSGVENCYDNAASESFFGLLIRERVHPRQYRTRAEARADILVDIERFDNSSRSHSFN